MGPKPATPDERLQFVLQCLHSIRDADGKVARPDFKSLSQLLNVKSNSAYVRYRDIVNREIESGVKGLHPVGHRAIAAAAAAAAAAATTQFNTSAALTTTSSPDKKAYVRKRKRSGDSFEEYEYGDDNDEVGTWNYDRPTPAKKIKTSKKRQLIKSPFSDGSSVTLQDIPPMTTIMTPTVTNTTPHSELDFGHSAFLDFDVASDLLHVGGVGRELEFSSDADADGESDIEY